VTRNVQYLYTFGISQRIERKNLRRKIMTKKMTTEEKEKKNFISFGSRRRTLTEKVNSEREFLENLIKPEFRGLLIFGAVNGYKEWMTRWADILVTFGGKYEVPLKRWTFKWGSVLDLQIMAKDEDGSKLAGMRFNWIEVDGKIDPAFQEMIMTKMYEKFKNKK
jgi:hypothetical protein